MLKVRCSVFFCLGLLLASSARADEVQLPTTVPAGPMDIRAPRLMITNDTVMASGGVTGRYENVILRADSASANMETGDLQLEGNIHFERGNVIWDGDQLDYNYLTQAGSFGPSRLDFDPVLMSVEHVERVSTNEYLLQGAVFTTCAQDHPHYHVKLKEARLVDQKYLKAKGATFYLGDVPVFYVPVWHQTLSRSVFTFRAGDSSEWGAYGLIKATVPWTKNFSSISDLNLYSKRGVGFGQGFAWNTPAAKGKFESFYLKDQDPNAKYDLPELGADRYRFKLEHYQNFSDTQYVNTKWNYLSDSVVLKEYFRSEYQNYAQPENYASWVDGNHFGGIEAFANYRLNDFYDNTDRVEVSADLYRTRMGNSPFYFQSENSIAHLERVYAETNVLDNVDAVRMDSANTVYMPQRYGFLSVVPRIGYRTTYYSKNAANSSDEFRTIAEGGMEVSLQATKVLSERERWYGKGLRHKIEPYLDYIYADASVGTNRLYQFDAIDTLGDENKVKVGLRNILQTKRNNRLARFMDIDLYTHYLIDNDDGSDNFDSLFIEARMPLTKRTMLDVDGEVDWNSGEVPFFNTCFSYKHSKELTLSLAHLYWQEQDQSLWSPRFDLYPDRKLSLFGYARYEDHSDDIEEFAVGGYMNWCCMRYGLGYHFYDENDHSIMLSIGLSAFPEASISSGF
jgi:hypothetical protein